MTKPYQVVSAVRNGTCQGKQQSASQAAAAWLAGLKSATAGQPVFVTPYADADIAALTRYGMNADLTRAFTRGPHGGQQPAEPRLHRAGRGPAAPT